MRQWSSLLLATLALVIPLAACVQSPESSSQGENQGGGGPATQSRLDTVKARGKLICGVDGGIPGFSFVDQNGQYSGLDVDVCKAVAAAIFNDPNAVEYRNLDSTERFEALKAGEVDMLSRNTTWTITRDTSVGMDFAPTTFYDGQGMMVRRDSGITGLQDFEGRAVCVEAGTTTELNLTDNMREAGVTPETKTFQQADPAYAAYAEGACDGMTSDKSQLVARRSTLPNPDDHILLDVTMSKEPLGPVTINNDSAWFDVVKWTSLAASTFAHLLWVPGRQNRASARFRRSRAPKICTSSPRITSISASDFCTRQPGTIQASASPSAATTSRARSSAPTGSTGCGAVCKPCGAPTMPAM